MRILFFVVDFSCWMGLVELASHYGLSFGRCCLLGLIAIVWNFVGFVEGTTRR